VEAGLWELEALLQQQLEAMVAIQFFLLLLPRAVVVEVVK
jgi:hypothetical protein